MWEDYTSFTKCLLVAIKVYFPSDSKLCLQLPFPDKPECYSPATTFFLYDHPINVTCDISAFPRVSKIYWKWNSSKETFESRATQKKSSKYDRSTGMFTVAPTGGYEDRELLCYAVNELGIQEKPCKFTVKVASKLVCHRSRLGMMRTGVGRRYLSIAGTSKKVAYLIYLVNPFFNYTEKMNKNIIKVSKILLKILESVIKSI